MGLGSKDHLALTTAFACTVGGGGEWSLEPGFTALAVSSGKIEPRGFYSRLYGNTNKPRGKGERGGGIS